MSRHFREVSILAFLAIIILCTSSAQAASSVASDLVDKAVECGVSQTSMRQLDDAVNSGAVDVAQGDTLVSMLLELCKSELPIKPFEDKLVEGLAKRVPPQRIIAALENMREQYVLASGVLMEQFGSADTAALALVGNGLTKGVQPDVFNQYIATYKDVSPEEFLVGLEMTSLLAQSGFDYGLTSSILDTGFAAGALTSEWRYLVRVVLIARKRGNGDDAVTAAARKSLSRNGSLDNVASQLGFTLRSLSGRNNSN